MALVAGDTLQQIADTPQAILARLSAHLGTPDAETFTIWKRVHNTPADKLDVAEWRRQDTLAHTQLSLHGEEFADKQRLASFRTCYQNSPAVMGCWADYCKEHPAIQDHSFIGALDYIERQTPNIRAALTRTDVGFPLAAMASPTPSEALLAGSTATGHVAHVAAESALYTQAHLDRAV